LPVIQRDAGYLIERKVQRELLKMFRYVHTNIIAKDASKLIDFYKTVFHCRSIDETRDLSGEWLDRLTGLSGVHIKGEHLLLPGYGEDHPTLEIFSYDTLKETVPAEINHPGIAHIAFEVDDVEATLSEIMKAGGSSVGELVTAKYPNSLEAVFVYARDPEGNILELQSWRKTKD
jgi:glyoxylase I family protein